MNHEEKNIKEVKLHNYIVCVYKSHDFAQSQENFVQSPDSETMTFRNPVYQVHPVYPVHPVNLVYPVHPVCPYGPFYPFYPVCFCKSLQLARVIM